MSNLNVIITKTARLKMVKARAGDITLPAITKMAFGDGGVDAGGTVIPPTANQTALTNELLRKNIESHEYPAGTDATCEYHCSLAENELVGYNISEIGLVDSDGDLVCIKTFTKKGKDSDMEHKYSLKDIF